ncbi:Ig-like domain-containing protein [Paucisalibacillus sp. EB02]|uniref:SwmB domain-containing protein n=1 Tax=Paucisalibacillus sp. EB02 TaxID=1347087 RepID=UPI0004BA9769|nr:Ig-like domain-containing protein [Paucisalibacillus sp. EB02]
MKNHERKISIFFVALLLFGTMFPGVGGKAIFAAGISTSGTEINYNEKVPSEVAEPVVVAPDLEITPEENEVFSGGNILFQIAEGNDPSEKLSLPNGTYTLEGGLVINVLDGVVYMDSNGDNDFDDPGEGIAKVNETFNGNGTALQIDFLTIPIPNGSFQEGAVGEFVPVPNWQINHTSVGPDGSQINQIWLGDKASKTKGRSYDSVTSNGDGTYTVVGPDGAYNYVTNVNYNNLASTRDPQSVEGYEAVFNSLNKYVNNVYTDTDSNSQALEIGFLSALLKQGDYAQKDGKIASSFGIEAISDPFEANAGDQLGFDWKANDGGDDYEVYGFLVNEATGNHIEILYGRGSAQNWTTNSGVIPADGMYRFRFVAGSFNRTDGTTHGATLSIDNIRILSGKVVASVAEQIGQLVTYETTELLGDRHVDITITNGVGEVSNTATVPILIDNGLERSLTIKVPNEGQIVYESVPVISGEVMSGSTVTVTVTGPNGYSYTGNASLTETGWEIDGLNELTEPGEYQVSVTATTGELDTNPPVKSTFNFVSKAELEDYVASVNDLKQGDYIAGWEDDDDDDIEFASALQQAKDLLEDIANTSDGSHPDQAAIDTALQNLIQAKEALIKHYPIESHPATFEHGGAEITVDFDKNVLLTNTENPVEGFTVLVDGVEYNVTTVVANGDKVVITVDQPLDSDAEITILYTKNEENPNLFGNEENGSADESFSVIATDYFGKELQIETTTGNTDNNRPVFTGNTHLDTDQVFITIYDSSSNPVLTEVDATLNQEGQWSYTIPEGSELSQGDYTFEVNAIDTESGRTVIKSESFTIVTKDALKSLFDEVIMLSEGDYRLGWDDFETALHHAEEVLNDPIASQVEVDEALTDLETKRDALEKHPPEAKKANFEDGYNEITVEFNKNITFVGSEVDPKAGFKVTIDDNEVSVIAVELVEVDSQGKTNKVKLTLSEDTVLSSDAKIEIEYNKAAGNSVLTGNEPNGTAVEDFVFQANDEFGKALQFSKPNGITNNTTPVIEGTADPTAERATLTIIGPDGEETIVTDAAIIVNPDGTWTYQVTDKLSPGEYEVQVTTTLEGRSDVTKIHTFIVVDKEKLNEDINYLNEQNLKAGHYTEESWAHFEEALNQAQNVTDNPGSTQVEVELANEYLEMAYQELVSLVNLQKESALSTELNKNHYSKESWDAYQRALEDANSVLNNPQATQKEVNEAFARLQEARNQLKVDKLALESLVDEDKNYHSMDYSKESWDAYQRALEDANSVLNNPQATQREVNEAFARLQEARNQLNVDKSALESLVDEDKNYHSMDYSKESWDAYQRALEDANSVLNNPQATQKEVNEALATLQEARNQLNVDKSALESLVDEDKNYHSMDYSKESWDAYQRALEDAESVLNNPNATQEEINEAFARLQEARNQLTVDKSGLKNLIDEVADYQSSYYTEESWKAYHTALSYAKDVLADSLATQAEVDEAFVLLKKAQDGLEPVEGDNLLPKTATNLYTLLAVGLASLLVGVLLFAVLRRKVNLQEK